MKIRLGALEVRLSRYLGLWSLVVVVFAMQCCVNDAVNARVWSPITYLRWSGVQWLTWAGLAPLVFRLGERHPIPFPLRLRSLARHIGYSLGVTLLAMVIGGIDRKLDYTLDQLGTQILQTTTIDPGSSFGGMVILPIDRDAGHPADIRVNVAFDGRVYAFGFRLTRSGIGVPAPVPAAARADAPGVQALPVDLAGEGGGE